MERPVLLVNPNFMRPPVAPIGLEYVAAALERAGYTPVLCDLAFAEDWRQALTSAVDEARPVATGVTIRNLDDAYFASQDFILAKTAEVIRDLLEMGAAPVVLGGLGFSAAPREVLRFTGAQYGFVGDGERFPLMLDALLAGTGLENTPGAVFRAGNGGVHVVAPRAFALEMLSAPPRRFLDAKRYFAEGGQAGLETKRGCGMACIYCVEPNARGAASRLRTPDSLVDELEDLLEQGIDAIHLCDSEFNHPPAHAKAFCTAIVRRGIHKRLRWYAYASPHLFDADLAKAMAGAGCAGVDFGADHADPEQLRRLGCAHGPEDIRRTLDACRQAGLVVMFDMLLGGPGETPESLKRAIGFMQELGPERVGLSCGVRVYPHTRISEAIRGQGPLDKNPHLHGATQDNEDLLRPIFYVDAAVHGQGIHALVSQLIDGDKRFLHADPSQLDGNYNYNDNSVLAQAIRNGARGAYWDILRQIA